MPVLPELRPMLEQIASARAREADAKASTAERRERIHAGMDQRAAAVVESPPVVARQDHRLSVPGGEIVVRSYRPPLPGSLPGHLYVHGGGWWLGTLDHRDAHCAWRAHDVGCVVVSVGYRLAPEYRYPIPVDDVYAALRWLSSQAGELGVDPDRLSVGGDSSGANLAAAAVLMSRDREGPRLVALALEIPALDLTMSQPSVEEYANGYVLTRDELAEQIEHYCDADRRTEPYASPALASDLTGLPATLIMTAEYDVLRDDGTLFARRLREAGVPAKAICSPGHVHGSYDMTRILESARKWRATVEEFLADPVSVSGGW
jgi:acetyl esterase